MMLFRPLECIKNFYDFISYLWTKSALITAAFGDQVMGMIFAHNDVSHLFITISGGWPSSTTGARVRRRDVNWNGRDGWLVFFMWIFFSCWLQGWRNDSTGAKYNVSQCQVQHDCWKHSGDTGISKVFLLHVNDCESRSRHLLRRNTCKSITRVLAGACWIFLEGIDIRMRRKYCHTASFMSLWYVSIRYFVRFDVMLWCRRLLRCHKGRFLPSNFFFRSP